MIGATAAIAVLDRGITPIPAEAPTTSGYALTVADPADAGNGGPLAYWRMASNQDEEAGNRDITWTGGTPTLVSGLPQNSNEASRLNGVTGSVANDAGLQLSTFSLSFWFVVHSLPDPEIEGTNDPIVSKDGSGAAAGDTTIYVSADGVLVLQMQSATTAYIISGPTIEVGQAHHCVLIADGTSFRGYVDGQFIGSNTNVTSAWSSNSRNLEFATSPSFANDADVTLDEVALYARALTLAEVLALAEKNQPPTTQSFDTAVPESATTAIDVTVGATYIGAKTDLIVTIVNASSVTAAGHSVSVNGATKDVDFVASAVTADEVCSFTFTIEDALGESNVSTCSVTVQNSGAVAPSIANPFIRSGSTTPTVSSMADLQTAINSASPGTEIRIASGTYTGGTRTLTPSGTHANPIVVSAAGGTGQRHYQ